MYLPPCGPILIPFDKHIVSEVQKLLFILLYSSAAESLKVVLESYRCVAEQHYLEKKYAQPAPQPTQDKTRLG